MIEYLERAREARLAAMQVGRQLPVGGGCTPMITAFVVIVGLTSYGAWNLLA